METTTWQSRLGFLFSALGSAVGLGNICLFPFLVGQYGGGAFLCAYMMALFLCGVPALISELELGRFHKKGVWSIFKSHSMLPLGFSTVLCAFLVSAFYSVLCGWVLIYFVLACQGDLLLSSPEQTKLLFETITANKELSITSHGIFTLACGAIVLLGVQKGIERSSKVMMPLLFLILAILTLYSWRLPGRAEALFYLFSFDFSKLSAMGWLAALGQAFFTLSLGQGTMITYGRYLSCEEDIAKSAWTIAFGDFIVSLACAFVVFSMSFSVGIEPQRGLGLLFEALPLLFVALPFSTLLSILFFAFVVFAAATSLISVLEPAIAFMMEQKNLSRKAATVFTASLTALFGAYLAENSTAFENTQLLCQRILIPLGALGACIIWGKKTKKISFFLAAFLIVAIFIREMIY